MRTIKFRGRRIDNNDWVYGYLYRLQLPNGEACVILTQDNIHLEISPETKYHLAFTLWVDLFIVDPITVGQFTGLYDKNGKEIYEGDIVAEGTFKRVISFIPEAAAFCSCSPYESSIRTRTSADEMRFYEVIGNIHDNPELQKGGKK